MVASASGRTLVLTSGRLFGICARDVSQARRNVCFRGQGRHTQRMPQRVPLTHKAINSDASQVTPLDAARRAFLHDPPARSTTSRRRHQMSRATARSCIGASAASSGSGRRSRCQDGAERCKGHCDVCCRKRETTRFSCAVRTNVRRVVLSEYLARSRQGADVHAWDACRPGGELGSLKDIQCADEFPPLARNGRADHRAKCPRSRNEQTPCHATRPTPP